MKKRKKEEVEEIVIVEKEDIDQLRLAIRIVREEKKASTSLLQRRLKIGYSISARLIDTLEEIGVLKDGALTGKFPILEVRAEPVKPPEPEKKKGGRPPKYDFSTAKQICDRIATGESVRQICRDEGMPEARTVYLWLLDPKREAFYKMYNKAREIQAEAIHDELFEIADDGTNDWMEREMPNGGVVTVPDHEHINRSRLRVDTRKWVLARMNPKKYGEKLDLSSGGKALKEPRPAVINYIVPPAPKEK